MALEQPSIVDNKIESPGSSNFGADLFNNLPLMQLQLENGNLNVQNVSNAIKQTFRMPSMESIPLDPSKKFTLIDAIRLNIDPEDQVIFDESEYKDVAKSIEEMEVGDSPITKTEMTYAGEIELRFRRLPENNVVLEVNPLRDRKDTLTGLYERDVFERRAKRVNKYLLDSEIPERLKPISVENPINAFFADANCLKKVNDGPGGHLAGNAYLLGISIALKAAVFGTEPMQNDIALKTFLESPDDNVYKPLFAQMQNPEFWNEFNELSRNFREENPIESAGRKITKMPDALYRYGGDEFIGFYNSDDIIGLRTRINTAIKTINEAIIRDKKLSGLLPQLSLALACAKSDGKRVSFLSESPDGEFYFDPNCNFNFSSFHNLINVMDQFMYRHKEMQKIYGSRNVKSTDIPHQWLQLQNENFIEDLRDY